MTTSCNPQFNHFSEWERWKITVPMAQLHYFIQFNQLWIFNINIRIGKSQKEKSKNSLLLRRQRLLKSLTSLDLE